MKGEEKRIREKIFFYMKQKLKCHLIKNDGFFLNGFFVEKESQNILIFKDDKLGLIHLFIFDIKDIEDYRETRI